MTQQQSTAPLSEHAEPSPADGHTQMPKRTTPTWEMELLLSGALVFSMLQLPALLDALLLQLLPRVSLGVSTALIIVGLYLRAGIFALGFAFIAHLAIRAYWVALIGTNSVFPGRPDWSKSWVSPIGKRVADAIWVPMEQRIDAADNVASIVFAMGIACMVMMLSLSVVISVMIALGTAMTVLSGGRISSFNGFLLSAALPLLMTLIGPLIDQALGKRLSSGGWLMRLVEKSYAWQMNAPGFVHFGAITNPIFLNVKLKSFAKFLIGLALMTVLIASLLSSMQSSQTRGRFENFLPTQSDELTLRPENFRNQRKGASRYLANATIESMELGDKALWLFVPLSVDRHRQHLLKACPDLMTLPRAQRGSAAHLQCAAALVAPRLDKQPIDSTGLSWMVDPHSGFEGLAWRVENARISPGRHEIRIKQFDRKDIKVTTDQVITFYR